MSHDADSRISRLEARIRQLEADIDQLRASLGGADASVLPPPPRSHPGRLAQLEQTPPPPTGAPAPAAARARQSGERRPFLVDTETILRWGGVALVVLAVGFAVSAAITRGWIGPELQLVGAVGLSLGLVAAGLHLRPTRLPWTHALCSGGVLALFSTFASDLFLEEASANLAFTCTAVVGLGGYALARTVPSTWVGAATLFGGGIGWLVIGDGEVPFHASLGWFVFLVAAALALSLEHRWFAVRFLAHGTGLIAILGMAGEADQPADRVLVLAAAAVLAASLACLPSIGNLKSIGQQLEVQLAALTAPWALGILAVALDVDTDTVVAWTALAVAATAAALAVGVRRWIQPSHLVSLLIGASVTLTIGLALLLSTSATFVGLAVQGAGLVVLSRSLGNNVRVLINAAVLTVVAALFALGAMVDAWDTDAPVGDDIAHIAIITALAVGGWQTKHRQVQQGVAVSVLGLVLIWLGSALVHLPQGQAIVSVSWAVVGTAILVRGAIQKVPALGATGLAVLALTVAKLLTVDLQEVDTLWRAGLFFLVGFGIMRLGFLLPRLTGMNEDNEDEREPERVA